MHFDERLRKLLDDKGVTAYRIHKDTGISQEALSSWKAGKSKPTGSNLATLSNYLGVTVDYLVKGDEQEHVQNVNTRVELNSVAAEEFSRRLQSLMEEKGYTAYRIAKELSVSKQTVGNWKSGVVPQGANLRALTNLLGVSTDYLLGSETKEARVNPVISEDDGRRAKFTKAFDHLNPEQQEIVLAMMREMLRKK